MSWYLEVLKKYAVFSGRARRAEFWYFTLVNIIVAIVLSIIDGILGTGSFLGAIYSLGVLLPGIGVAIRRLHDTDKSGWWLLLGLLPIIGVLILLVFYLQDGTQGPNKYGPSPKYGLAAPPPAGAAGAY